MINLWLCVSSLTTDSSGKVISYLYRWFAAPILGTIWKDCYAKTYHQLTLDDIKLTLKIQLISN